MRTVKKALCRLFAVILAICLVAGAMTSVSAAVPVDSYTYWSGVTTSSKAVYTKSMYGVDKLIDPTDLGIEPLSEINAICKDKNNNI